MDIKKLVEKLAILTIAFFSLLACDDDFKEVGTSIVDSGNFEALHYDHVALSSTSKKLTKVQTNLLSSYALGVYKDPHFGTTKADLITQFSLSQSSPTFYENSVLDSVVLNIPFFSTVKDQDDDQHTYSLDSLYGDEPIKLSIYRSGYFLRNFDPLNEFDVQAYYSNDVEKFEDNIVGDPLVVGKTVTPSDKEIVVKGVPGGEDSIAEPDRLTPALRVKLPVDVFDELILQKEGSSELSNNDNFQNYFRGLYIKVDGAQGDGFYGLLNVDSEEAGITLFYHNAPENEGDKVKEYGRYKLNMGSQVVNLFEGGQDGLDGGEEDLVVKGGAGSVALIDLFKDPEQLDSLRNVDWLVNEASLKLYVDQDKLPADYDLPERIFVFDASRGKVLKDYTNAEDVQENDILNSRTTHLGRLKKDDDGNLFYRIRLTQYIDDILNQEAANTRLGIAVSQNVNEESFINAELESGEMIKIPRSEAVARNGVVFFGDKNTSEKALKLEIFYTETKN